MNYKPPSTAPSDVAKLTAARAAYDQGRFGEAESACRSLLSRHPNDTDALLLLANIALSTGRGSLAHQLLRTVLSHNPNSVEALIALARLLRTARVKDEGIELCRRAIAVAPSDPEAHFVLGICCLDAWRFPEAIKALESAIALRPGFAMAYDRLGFVLHVDGRNGESITAYRKAIELMPDSVVSYANLGNLLARGAGPEEAELMFDRAEQAAAESTDQFLALSQIQHSHGNAGRAEKNARRALELAPGNDDARILLSQVLQEAGRFDEARKALRDGLAINPANTGIYRELAYSGTVTPADRPRIDSMIRLLAASSGNPKAGIQLNFALGKSFEDLGEYGSAMRHFHEANRIALRVTPGVPRDRKALADHVDSMISTFTPEFFGAYRGPTSASEEPVFIVGMPRSGTTLLEQIVSSHPDVGGAGELLYVSKLAPTPSDPNTPLSPALVQAFTEGYLHQIRAVANGERRITDKLPDNYKFAGLIHLFFPRARIIHCRRNPIDTCLSIYITPITVAFSHSLSDIAYAYKQQERLMAHWRSVLPADRLTVVDYEELVANPEPVIRRVVEFLGIPWNDAVLRHESNDRAISTASRWQARQPLHTASVERWRRFEPWIGDLLREFQ